ncbi:MULTISPECIES: hypothetical protein [Bacillus cereus group]|uniref:Lipoprotein n=1 Tax=Bacillus cereus HuA2-1 TaxID=1053201 RepID=J9BC31_BACCE|nr:MULTISPECIES: hypothetical protein [Bacillus cereus group]EJV76531.1 hypothetical protein IG3_05219 [Bacillus cereus HuA2-1]EOO12670.1 hypothetical protein IG9_05401 [Bacillus cereus HuA2-9]MCZ6943039.1 hypothetical protein [Bacillus mycoides]
MKKFLWMISTMCIALGLVTGCSSKGHVYTQITYEDKEFDQKIGSETKGNNNEQDNYETISVPVKKEEYTGKIQHPELIEQTMRPVPEENKKQYKNKIVKATISFGGNYG